ncbi:MAG: peptidylprolyl isomerase [Gemmatimonadota bacterium]|nr:peptidylprolyl isomerase [Gemmatimonadota bacterium]
MRSLSGLTVGFIVVLSALSFCPGCRETPPRSGMQMAQIRDHEAQKKERDVIVIETDLGDIVILPATPAKKTIRKIKELVDQGFYNGLTFHYVEQGSMIQGGDMNTRDDDPTNDGAGDPGFILEAEEGAPNMMGGVGLAHPPGEPNAGNSQFYILLKDRPELNGRYTVFGFVVEGLDVVNKISRVQSDENGRPLENVRMKQVYVEKRFV